MLLTFKTEKAFSFLNLANNYPDNYPSTQPLFPHSSIMYASLVPTAADRAMFNLNWDLREKSQAG